MISRPFFALVFLVSFVNACSQVPPPTLYVLKEDVQKEDDGSDALRVTVALGPISVSDYLDRTDIVRHASASRLIISETERWAEPLRAGLQRVLAANLSARLGSRFWITTSAGHGGSVDMEVPIDVQTFEPEADGRIVLRASWEVHSLRDDRHPIRHHTTFVSPPPTNTTEDQIAAMSTALASFADDIAQAVRKAKLNTP